MTEPVRPPYTPTPGGIGEKISAWLLNIPILGDIIERFSDRESFINHLTATGTQGELEWYAANGDSRIREAAARGLRERFPNSANVHAALGDWMAKVKADPSSAISAAMQGVFSSPLVKELSETAGAMVYDSIMSMAIGGAENLSPELAERVRRFLGTTVLLGVAPKVGGALAEMTSVGAFKTLGDLFRDAYFNLGLGFVTWQMTSPLVDAGIGQELRRQANLAFRPARFSWAQVRDLYALGELSYDQVREHLAGEGYRDEDIDKTIRLAYKSISEGTLMGMWSVGILDDAECARRLREFGYSPENIDLIMRYQKQVAQDNQKEVLLSTARKAFTAALIGESRYREILGDLNYTDEAIDLEIAVSSLTAHEEAKSLSVSQLKEAYLSNVITEVESTSGLLALGFRSDEISTLIETWKRSRAPDVLRVNKQTILQALSRGVLTESEARYKLAELHYPPEDVDLILKTAQAEGGFTKPKASIGQLIEGARNNLITVTELENELRSRGYPDFDATLIIRLATFERKLELTPEQILDAYAAGILTATAAEESLVAAGYTRTTAAMRVRTTTLDVEAKRPRAPLGVLMALTATGMMTEENLRAWLVERGYQNADIAAIIAASLYKPLTPLSQNMVVNAYVAGVLNRDDALGKLAILGLSAADANTILLTAESRMTVTQPRASISVYVAATRDGILTANQLRDKLASIGLAGEDIELFVQLAIYSPAEPAKKLSKTEAIEAYKAFIFTRVDALRRLEMLGYGLEDADVLLHMVRRDPQDSQIHTLYQAGVLTAEQAGVFFSALGYTDEQIETYFEKYAKAV